jgi:hypothetical protein
MKNILYLIAFILFIAWLVLLLFFDLGGMIHILLILSIITVIIHIVRGQDTL